MAPRIILTHPYYSVESSKCFYISLLSCLFMLSNGDAQLGPLSTNSEMPQSMSLQLPQIYSLQKEINKIPVFVYQPNSNPCEHKTYMGPEFCNCGS